MKNEYLVTQKRFLLWGVQCLAKPPRIYLILFWACLTVLTVILLCMGGNVPINILIFAYCFYQAFLRDAVITYQQYRKLVQSYEKTQWLRTISFREDGFTVKEEQSERKYQYADLIDIKVKKKKVLLTANDKTEILVLINSFADGDWEQCKELLKAKNSRLIS